MEVVDVITTLISNVGFPIAAFIMMWYQNLKVTKAMNSLERTVQENTEAIKDLQEKIK